MKSEVNAKQSKLKKNIPLYVLLLPSIILLILFAYIPMAVSYTHLDVYKRQVEKQLKSRKP